MGRKISANKTKCLQCKYHAGGDAAYISCDYYLRTGKRRNCDIGVCDKFETGKSKMRFERMEDVNEWEEILIE